MAAALRRLSGLANLTQAEVDQILALGPLRRRWRAGSLLQTGGPQLVINGWACSQRVLRDGRRQIYDLVVAGEGIGWRSAEDAASRRSVVALTMVETVDLAGLLYEGQSGLRDAVLASLAEEDVRRFDHIVRLGRLTAYEKAAHFVLEMQHRLGAADARTFPLPLTQEVIADVLGLSIVHLNRVLRQFRTANLVEIRGGMATVGDARALAAAAILPVGRTGRDVSA
jgi:CRP-like cAMP-binding protein